MKKLILALLATLVIGKLLAQDDVQLSQVYSNKLYYNPAATGASDMMYISGAYRGQWLGSSEIGKGLRPSYLLFNVSQFFWEQRSGVGLTIYDQRQSVNHTFQIKGSYAYHMQLDEAAWLALGINGGLVWRSITGSMVPDPSLPVGWADYKSGIISDLGLGAEYYTPELCVGLSGQHIPLVFGTVDAKMHMHWYYYMTYFYKYDRDWRFIPMVTLRSSSFIHSFDVSVRASYLDMFQIGLSARMDALSILLGLNLNNTLSIGYSFDISMSYMNKRGGRPSHEIVLSYRAQVLDSYNDLDRLYRQEDF
ncbi:MAG: PorP/SprF family type IX secretion system membrane protein [Bacteroidales bacterium]|jgi:type IX secretion system PorP/SprF family membrane protein|nr:PorP/SprF family type IX secretion system membrane protein [Bacteroidales bacterium]